MFDVIKFAKQAAKTTYVQRGRNVKGENMQKQLHAAGQARQNVPGVFKHPSGFKSAAVAAIHRIVSK